MPYLVSVINSLNVRIVSYKIVPPIERLPLAGLTTQSFLSCDAMLITVQVGLASPLNQALKRMFDIASSNSSAHRNKSVTLDRGVRSRRRWRSSFLWS